MPSGHVRVASIKDKIDFDLAHGSDRLAGVDEAGRGPLAGPVVAAAVILPLDEVIVGIEDSKRLTPARRQSLLPLILARARAVGLGIVDAEAIDRLNILEATRLAMGYALCGLWPRPALALIDGLQPPAAPPDGLGNMEFKTIPRGDTRSYSIGAASIVAKCVRDAIMRSYEAQHPGYGFGRHKGYGTAQHLQALAKLGPCPIHRRSFWPVSAMVPERRR